jgi:hypothetical protein
LAGSHGDARLIGGIAASELDEEVRRFANTAEAATALGRRVARRRL